jgi:hypothetical protein
MKVFDYLVVFVPKPLNMSDVSFVFFSTCEISILLCEFVTFIPLYKLFTSILLCEFVTFIPLYKLFGRNRHWFT